MKHIVNVTISNPAHEFVSMRRRQSTTNYMVEARDEAEAIFRASNHFKKLGHYVHNAVIAESTLNEEVEQVEIASTLVAPASNEVVEEEDAWRHLISNDEFFGKLRKKESDKVLKKGTAIEKIYHNKGVGYANAQKALRARTPETKEKARADMETSGRLSSRFNRKSYNRLANIPLAAARLAKEEVKRQAEPPPSAMPSDTRIKPLPKAKKGVRIGSTNKFGHYTPGMKEEVELDEDALKARQEWMKAKSVSTGDPKADRARKVKRLMKTFPMKKEEVVNEKAPPGAKYERMVKHIKDKYSEDGTLTPKEKAIAYATAWKAKNSGK
jgi:hypothetical protein